jgi:hypothetical protein
VRGGFHLDLRLQEFLRYAALRGGMRRFEKFQRNVFGDKLCVRID